MLLLLFVCFVLLWYDVVMRVVVFVFVFVCCVCCVFGLVCVRVRCCVIGVWFVLVGVIWFGVLLFYCMDVV